MYQSGFASKCTDFAAQIAVGAALLASLLYRPAHAEALPPDPSAPAIVSLDRSAADAVRTSRKTEARALAVYWQSEPGNG